MTGSPSPASESDLSGGESGGIPALAARVGGPTPPWRPRLSDRTIAVLMLVPAIALLLVTTVYPIANAIILSFHQYNPSLPLAKPVFNNGENYVRLLSDPAFLNTIRITVIFVVVAVILELLLGLGLGLLITAQRRGIGIVRVAMLLPFMMAPVAAGVLWRTLFNVQWGPLNDILRTLGLPEQQFLASPDQALASVIMVEVWQQVPPVAFIVAAGILSISPDLFKASAVDGASFWQTFRHVTLPMLRPIIAIILLLRVMDAFKVYDIIQTLTEGGPATQTENVSYLIWKTGMRFFQTGYASAMSVVFLVIVFLISLVFIRALDRAQSATGAER